MKSDYNGIEVLGSCSELLCSSNGEERRSTGNALFIYQYPDIGGVWQLAVGFLVGLFDQLEMLAVFVGF